MATSYDRVSTAVAAAARTLQHPESIDEALLAIALSARDSVPGFDLVGISTLEKGNQVVSRAVSDPRVCELDRLQYSEGDGPCVDALGTSQVVLAPRLRHEQRWPRYVPKALQLGLRSQLAVQLTVDDAGTLGSLNMYSTLSDDIDSEAAALAELFARHAAVALGGARHVGNLQTALQSRKVIGQALGIVMERYQLDEERAFAFLVRASNTGNLKLHTIAQELVDEANSATRRTQG
jgi:GAF domain-containing protein